MLLEHGSPLLERGLSLLERGSSLPERGPLPGSGSALEGDSLLEFGFRCR